MKHTEPRYTKSKPGLLEKGVREMNHPDLQKVAKRVVWFKPPDDALKDVKLFLAHAMTYGTLGDIATTLRFFLRVISRPY